MSDLDETMRKKLLRIVHRACVDMRRLSQLGENEIVYDLADTVEFIPDLLLRWVADYDGVILSSLEAFQKRHPKATFDYVRIFEMEPAVFEASLHHDTTTPEAIAFIENKPLASVPK